MASVERLKAAIIDRKMTEKEFSTICGYEYGYVISVLNEHRPLCYNFAQNAAPVLGVSAAWLLGDSNFPSDEAAYKAGYEDGYNKAIGERNG